MIRNAVTQGITGLTLLFSFANMSWATPPEFTHTAHVGLPQIEGLTVTPAANEALPADGKFALTLSRDALEKFAGKPIAKVITETKTQSREIPQCQVDTLTYPESEFTYYLHKDSWWKAIGGFCGTFHSCAPGTVLEVVEKNPELVRVMGKALAATTKTEVLELKGDECLARQMPLRHAAILTHECATLASVGAGKFLNDPLAESCRSKDLVQGTPDDTNPPHTWAESGATSWKTTFSAKSGVEIRAKVLPPRIETTTTTCTKPLDTIVLSFPSIDTPIAYALVWDEKSDSFSNANFYGAPLMNPSAPAASQAKINWGPNSCNSEHFEYTSEVLEQPVPTTLRAYPNIPSTEVLVTPGTVDFIDFSAETTPERLEHYETLKGLAFMELPKGQHFTDFGLFFRSAVSRYGQRLAEVRSMTLAWQTGPEEWKVLFGREYGPLDSCSPSTESSFSCSGWGTNDAEHEAYVRRAGANWPRAAEMLRDPFAAKYGKIRFQISDRPYTVTSKAEIPALIRYGVGANGNLGASEEIAPE